MIPFRRRDLGPYKATTYYPRAAAAVEARGYYESDEYLDGLYSRDMEFEDELLFGRDADEYDMFDF